MRRIQISSSGWITLLLITLLNFPLGSLLQAMNEIQSVSAAVSPRDLPEQVLMHTATTALLVTAEGRVAFNTPRQSLSYYADSSDYLFDGSLILGNSADNISWSMYRWLGGQDPTTENPFGYMLPFTNFAIDSTSSTVFRKATAKGVNRDSTLEFQVGYYCSKGAGEYYVARFAVYKGPSDSLGIVSNLAIAFAADWDIPSDSGSANSAFYDGVRQIVYQRGTKSSPNNRRYGGLAVLRDDNVAIPGGFAWSNVDHVYPLGTFRADSLWNRIQSTNGYQVDHDTTDLSSVIVVARDLTINGTAHDTFYFSVVLAGTRNGTIIDLTNRVIDGYRFACTLAPICPACSCACGDADNSGGVPDITDAVFLLAYIFQGGPEPQRLCQGDTNGDAYVDISDVLMYISFIFGEGGPPICTYGYPFYSGGGK